jgi:hypothetical protein
MTSRCYGIDGTPYATLDRYIPCNATSVATGGHTSCCAPSDKCLTNGFCQNPYDNQIKANIFWRNGCTDPTWNDPACPKYCEGMSMQFFRSRMCCSLTTLADHPDTLGVFYCLAQNSWCCSTGRTDVGLVINTTCCSRTDLVFAAANPLIYTIAEFNFVATTVQSLRVAATSTPALTNSISVVTGSGPAQSSQSAPPSSSSSSSSSSSNDKIGVYVGVPLGIALAIVLAIVAWLIKRKRKTRPSREPTYAYPNELTAENNAVCYSHTHVDEMGMRPEELPSGEHLRPMAELGNGDQ